jgi:hypothetical protein
VFNQVTEIHRVSDLPGLVSRLTGTQIAVCYRVWSDPGKIPSRARRTRR